MDIFGIDETLAGLKRGAEKFGTRVAAAVVKRMARRVNASNGFSPREAEPYGAGMGGADTEQESQVPTQGLNNAEPAKDRNGRHGYIGYCKGKQYEVYADSAYGAVKKLAAQIGKKESDISVDLAEKDVNPETGKGTQVTTYLDNGADELKNADKVEVKEVRPGKWAAVNPTTGAYQEFPEKWMAEEEARKFEKKNTSGLCPCGGEVKRDPKSGDPIEYTCQACGQQLGADELKNADEGPSDAHVEALAWAKHKQHWDELSSNQQEEILKFLEKKNADGPETKKKIAEIQQKMQAANLSDDAFMKLSDQLDALMKTSDLKNDGGVDSSALGYQSAQRTTTAQRADYCDACDRFKTNCVCGMENDGPLLSRCPACGLDSQEEWAGKCAGCGTENEKDAGGNAAVKENSIRKNSYGNVDIDGDIKRGLTDEQIASKISERYPHIGKNQALRIASQVRKGGPDASADWGDESSDIMASSKDNAKLPFDMSCDSCGKKLVQESQVAQCEKCDANLCGACRERVAGDTYCEKCAEDARQNTSAKENAVKFRVEPLDDGRWEVAFGSGRAGEIFEDKKEAERRALELNDGKKNAGDLKNSNSWKTMSRQEKIEQLSAASYEMGGGLDVNMMADFKWGDLPSEVRKLLREEGGIQNSNVGKKNAGHMGPDAWIAASLDERCAWLESAGLDVNLATLRFQDLSEDAHVALQDRMDMPASRNNLGSLAAGAKHGAASVESTGEDLPGPVSMGGGALGNASGPTKCSWCLGTGMGPCPKCEGEYETSKDCICKGTGHTKCADCKGTGKIENASGPTKIFSFKDANGEIETVAAESEQEAWQKLSRDFGTSIEDIHGMGIKLASVMENASDAFGRVLVCPRCKSNKLVPAPKEYGNGYYECSACGDGTWSRAELIDMDSFKNSKVQEPCPTCGLPKQMRPVGGDDDSFVCGNRKCSSFKNDIDLEDHGTHKKCPVCAGPVKWQEGLGQSSHEYACARCGQNFDETELKNANSVGDLEEIARHAEGIEHEIGEMMENSAWKHRKVGDFTYSSGSAAGRDECTECGKSIKTGDKVTLVTSGDVSDGNATDIYCANCTPSEARNDGRIDNRAIPESKIGEEIAHHIKDKGMDPDQAVAAAYSETRNSGVSRGQDKYGSKDK